MRTKGIIGLLYAISAGCIWSTVGATIKIGIYLGGDILWIGAIRTLFTSIPLIVLGRFKNFFKKELIAFGLLIIAPFQITYFKAIQEVGISVAVLLLYTSPAWVMILSKFLFNEHITRYKIVSLILAIIGVFFLSDNIGMRDNTMSALGLISAISSGFLYALITVYGKYLGTKGFATFDISTGSAFWAFLILTLYSSFISKPSLGLWLVCAIYLGLIGGALAYYLLFKSVKLIEASKVGFITLIEPALGVSIGVLIFNEVLTLNKILGSFLIFSSLTLIIASTIFKDKIH
ncbi:MAG: DMT family transporter [Nitrososphaerales archaeon]